MIRGEMVNSFRYVIAKTPALHLSIRIGAISRIRLQIEKPAMNQLCDCRKAKIEPLTKTTFQITNLITGEIYTARLAITGNRQTRLPQLIEAQL